MAAFICPRCSQKTLLLEDSIAVPPWSSMANTELLQALKCSGCGFTAMGHYTESSAGALGDDSSYHNAYPLSDSSYTELAELIAKAKDNPATKTRLDTIYTKRFINADIEIPWSEEFPLRTTA